MGAVRLVPCACGCGRVVLPIRRHRFATRDCRARGARCTRCHQAAATAGFTTCPTCRAAHRAAVARCLATDRVSPRYRETRNIEAVFQQAKAHLRRTLHVDPWAQKSSWAAAWDQ